MCCRPFLVDSVGYHSQEVIKQNGPQNKTTIRWYNGPKKLRFPGEPQDKIVDLEVCFKKELTDGNAEQRKFSRTPNDGLHKLTEET